MGTGINAFASLIFMIIVTRINDVNEAGIFTFAFSLATLFNVIGTYAGRIYQVTEKKDISNNEFLVNRLITCFVMMVIAVGFVILKKYELNKIIIVVLLCIWKMLEAFSDVIYAFLQKNDELYKVGVTLTIKNILGIAVFLVVDLITKNLIISILSFIIVYTLVMIFYDFIQADMRKQIKGRVEKKNVLDIFVKGFPTFCVTFLNIYIINASKYAIDGLMADSYQAIFGIIVMPATLMILLAQFMVHPFLNIINNYVEKNDYKSVNKLLIKISACLFVIGVVAIVFCYFLGIYILEFVYGISLIDYNLCLSIILVGSIFSALTSVIITILIAMRYTVIQMIIYIAVTVCAYISSNILVQKFGVMGASVSYSLIMITNCIIFYLTYLIIVKKTNSKNFCNKNVD